MSVSGSYQAFGSPQLSAFKVSVLGKRTVFTTSAAFSRICFCRIAWAKGASRASFGSA